MKFQIFSRMTWRGKQWFWRLRARNNKSIAIGGEGFRNRKDIERIVTKMKVEISGAEIEVLP